MIELYNPESFTSALETIALLLPTFSYSFVVTTIESVYKFSDKSKIILELLLLAIPALLSVTVLSDYVLHMTIAGFVVCCILVYFCTPICEATESNSKEVKFITNVRAVTLFVTTIAILAVDFEIFPRRFTKNSQYGFSLMDLGVGLFIFSNGIVANELRRPVTSMLKVLQDTIPLLILGLARFLVLKEIDYKVSVSEYGVHWNFFLTLAATKLLCSVILKFVNVKYSFIIGIVVLTMHEYMLQKSLADFVFNYKTRENFLTANKEGIVSSFGYVGLYFLSVTVGILLKKFNNRTTSSFKCVLLFFVLCLSMLLILTYFLNNTFRVSRRIANSGYCLWITFVGVFITTIYYVLEQLHNKWFKKFDLSFARTVPYLFEAINYNGLAYFLIANILTGSVNMLFDTMIEPVNSALAILIVYMCLKNISAVILLKLEINLKKMIFVITNLRILCKKPTKNCAIV